MTSRSVSLTSTFLLLAAGGVAACDSGNDTQDEGFYCADENGVVVSGQFRQTDGLGRIDAAGRRLLAAKDHSLRHCDTQLSGVRSAGGNS